MTNPERLARLLKKLTHEEMQAFVDGKGSTADGVLAWADAELRRPDLGRDR